MREMRRKKGIKDDKNKEKKRKRHKERGKERELDCDACTMWRSTFISLNCL
jgi:hypothetical protein